MNDKYMLFFGDNYYPSGGFDDFGGTYATIEDALTFLVTKSPDWWHIVDVERKQIVKQG